MMEIKRYKPKGNKKNILTKKQHTSISARLCNTGIVRKTYESIVDDDVYFLSIDGKGGFAAEVIIYNFTTFTKRYGPIQIASRTARDSEKAVTFLEGIIKLSLEEIGE